MSENEKISEIKITPKMLEAGARAVREYDNRFESADEAAERIFTAMVAAKRHR